MTTESPPGAFPAPSGPMGLASTPCPQCGGSGVLRMSEQRFRTCLDCLGQGHQPRHLPQPRLQDLIQQEHLQREILRPEPSQPHDPSVNAGAFSSGSR